MGTWVCISEDSPEKQNCWWDGNEGGERKRERDFLAIEAEKSHSAVHLQAGDPGKPVM